jgi:hypothetical protein
MSTASSRSRRAAVHHHAAAILVISPVTHTAIELYRSALAKALASKALGRFLLLTEAGFRQDMP